MNPIDAIILGRLYDRPNWAKSLYRVKPRLTALVNAGFVERIAPPSHPNSRGKNMVQLTPQGVDLIEAYWGAHPT